MISVSNEAIFTNNVYYGRMHYDNNVTKADFINNSDLVCVYFCEVISFI
jgi:hypothetical protein